MISEPNDYAPGYCEEECGKDAATYCDRCGSWYCMDHLMMIALHVNYCLECAKCAKRTKSVPWVRPEAASDHS